MFPKRLVVNPTSEITTTIRAQHSSDPNCRGANALKCAISIPLLSICIATVAICLLLLYRRYCYSTRAQRELLERLKQVNRDAAKSRTEMAQKIASSVGKVKSSQLVLVLKQQTGSSEKKKHKWPKYMQLSNDSKKPDTELVEPEHTGPQLVTDDHQEPEQEALYQKTQYSSGWIDNVSTEVISGMDSGIGKVQLGVKYDRGPTLPTLDVAVLQASGLPKLHETDKPRQSLQLQALNWWEKKVEPKVIACLQIRNKESTKSVTSPAVEFNEGCPMWRHVFQFVDFTEEFIEQCQFNIELKQVELKPDGNSEGHELSIGDTTLELNCFVAGDNAGAGREGGHIFWRFLERSNQRGEAVRSDEKRTSQ